LNLTIFFLFAYFHIAANKNYKQLFFLFAYFHIAANKNYKCKNVLNLPKNSKISKSAAFFLIFGAIIINLYIN